MNARTLQEQFAKGKLPRDLNGFYKGNLLLLLPHSPLEHVADILSHLFVPWKGKCFYKDRSEGDNILPMYTKQILRLYSKKIKTGRSEFGGFHAFTFKTRREKSLMGAIEVLQLDYDLSENPSRIRTVVDELVETGHEQYLGKAYIKRATTHQLIAFFRLSKR